MDGRATFEVSMAEHYEVFLKLIISGEEMSLGEVTEVVGLAPTKLCKRGTQKRPQIATFNEGSRWIYSFCEGENSEPGELLGQFFNVLDERKSVLLELSRKMDICIFFAIYKGGYFPAVCISKRQVEFLNSIGARLDFDIYG